MNGIIDLLPHVDAGLNALATTLLLLGLALIKRGHTTAHKWVMLSCFGVSVVFLACYLTHKASIQGHGKPFPKSEYPLAWNFYWPLLLSHVVLAATVPFLALLTIYRGLKGQWTAHRLIARWTFPIWLYVSITGVLVYVLLYHVYAV